MKKVFVLLTVILTLSCSQTNSKPSDAIAMDDMITETKNFDWLLGKWIRLNEETGKKTFESWTKISLSAYSGIGFTMQNGDTIKREFMHLEKVGSNWKFSVEALEEKDPTIFEVVDFNKSGFTCKNDSIDFPNVIKYWIKDERLFADVYNSAFKVSFEFEKTSEVNESE